jgi:hypothetical protein
LRARARVSSFGAASASAADGVSGRRFALTLQKPTTASRYEPSVAASRPNDGDAEPKRRAESATFAPYRKSKYLVLIGLGSRFSVDNPASRSRICAISSEARSRFCAHSSRRSVGNFSWRAPFWAKSNATNVADSACSARAPSGICVRRP